MIKTAQVLATQNGPRTIQAHDLGELILHRPVQFDSITHDIIEKSKGFVLTHKRTGRRICHLDGPFSDALARSKWAEARVRKLWQQIDGTKKNRPAATAAWELVGPVLTSTREALDAIENHGS